MFIQYLLYLKVDIAIYLLPKCTDCTLVKMFITVNDPLQIKIFIQISIVKI